MLKDSHGGTPLFYCLRNYNKQRGLHSDFPDSKGHHLQSYLNNIEEGNKILKYLVECGVDINCRGTEDLSVLDHAYTACEPFATFLLFKYGGVIRRNCREKFRAYDWYLLIIAKLANAHFWRHLVRHRSVCIRIYLDIIDEFCKRIGRAKILEPFFLITPDT